MPSSRMKAPPPTRLAARPKRFQAIKLWTERGISTAKRPSSYSPVDEVCVTADRLLVVSTTAAAGLAVCVTADGLVVVSIVFVQARTAHGGARNHFRRGAKKRPVIARKRTNKFRT